LLVVGEEDVVVFVLPLVEAVVVEEAVPLVAAPVEVEDVTVPVDVTVVALPPAAAPPEGPDELLPL
jgi:hypothetical protein